jgi:hypothetical protein
LNDQGYIQGHLHAVIQRIANNSQDKLSAPNPHLNLDSGGDFFSGMASVAADGHSLQVSFTPTVPGLYRLCTMTGSYSHQPMIMPTLERGSDNDCIRFTVVA